MEPRFPQGKGVGGHREGSHVWRKAVQARELGTVPSAYWLLSKSVLLLALLQSGLSVSI